MLKKLLFYLLTCAVIFAFSGVMLQYGSRAIRNYGNQDQQTVADAKFERFIGNIQDGTWQLTPDQMIHMLRLSRELDKANSQVAASFANAIGWHSVFEFVGCAWMIWVVLVYHRRLTTRSYVEATSDEKAS